MSTGHEKAMERKRRIHFLYSKSNKTEKEVQEYKLLIFNLTHGTGEKNYIGLDNPLHPRTAK